jgi:hypothetical protein
MCKAVWAPETQAKLETLTKAMDSHDVRCCLHEATLIFKSHIDRLLPDFLLKSVQCQSNFIHSISYAWNIHIHCHILPFQSNQHPFEHNNHIALSVAQFRLKGLLMLCPCCTQRHNGHLLQNHHPMTLHIRPQEHLILYPCCTQRHKVYLLRNHYYRYSHLFQTFEQLPLCRFNDCCYHLLSNQLFSLLHICLR